MRGAGVSNFSATLALARAALPLRRYMEQHGKAPTNGNWKAFPQCPWCGHGGAGVFTPKSGDGGELFKCHHEPCPTNNDALDEIAFIGLVLGLKREEAWKTYFKDAGVWKENLHAPSIMPGFKARKTPPMTESHEEESLVQDGIAVIRSEQKASVSLLQRRLRLGYVRAAALMDELERRGIVGPAKGQEPRAILKLPESSTSPQPSPQSGEGENDLPSVASAAPASAPAESTPAPEESGAPVDPMVVPPPAAANAVPEGNPPPPDPGTATLSEEKITPPADAGNQVKPVVVEPPSPAVAALRWFYERLTLVESDRLLLWQKRGLHAGTADALGYRSNLKANKDLLLELAQHFPPQVLLESGLYSQGEKPGDPPKPNAQFFGMSLVERRDEATGKKVRDADGEVIVDLVWGDPGAILIPYFDELGDLIHLRPHKGMMKGKTPRLYLARPSRAWREANALDAQKISAPSYAGLTEGEFKAGAIWQVVGDECAVGALPGITLAKLLFADIEEWLEELSVRQVFVGYDNEDKGDPKLPGYQEDKWKRFDAQIWARFLAARISKEGYEGKVCTLPDAWRDDRGKADWDGQLARMLDAEFARRKAAGKEIGGLDLWKAAAPLIRAEFVRAIKASVPVREMWQAGLFDSEEERIIKNGVERIAFERALPVGGDDEETIARRLQRLVKRLKREEAIPPKARNFLGLLAKKYGELKGGYYTFKRLQAAQDVVWHGYMDKAANTSDADLRRACEIALKGIPERVSDFYMKAHYVLVKLDGTRERLVSLHNIHGVKTGLKVLPSEPFSQPSKFRHWLLNNISGATWKAGERELNDLQSDIARDVAFKEISEVAVRGYHEESKCWFFGDVVYTEDGRELFADKSGIIWLKNKGGVNEAYKLSEKDHEGQKFCHGTPRMKPATVAEDAAVATLFTDASAAMNQTLGGSIGFLTLGAILSYGAGPEIYDAHNGFPGLWLHGETSQGKSSVARWLMRLWGFKVDGGMPLADSTKVGISIALQQYGNLPVFLEEWQPDAQRWMVEKIKNIYNRESGIKKTFDEGTRKILTSVIITGIATCADAQVKSRYVHVQVAEKNRMANHYTWFEENSPRFYQIGRYILRHRKAFAALSLAKMTEILNSEEMAQLNQRSRIVHCASYGAFAALAEILGTHSVEEMNSFRGSLVKHCAEAAGAVKDQVNVNLFWRDLLDAIASPTDPFGAGSDLLNIFHLQEISNKDLQLPPKQLSAAGESPERYGWRSWRLSFLPGPVIEMLRRQKRLSGRDLPLDKGDLRAQMQVRPYWVTPPAGRSNIHKKFGRASRTNQACWSIDVDKHELGYQAVTDEEFQESLYQPGKQAEGIFLPGEDWVDPRKGDLFSLIEKVLRAKSKSEET